MSSSSYMTTMMNCINDLRRDVYDEIITELQSKELLTDDIKEVIETMKNNVKTNKKVKKEKKPRYSGYHLFMKEHRVVVKKERPDIKPQELTSVVSKAWKDIPEEQKKDFNDRALKMKEGLPVEKEDKTQPEKSPVKEVKKTQTKKKKPAKKPPTPPPSEDEESDVDINIENADSDIDL